MKHARGITLAATLVLALVGASLATATSPQELRPALWSLGPTRIAPLVFRLHRDRQTLQCTPGIPDSMQIAVWVSIDRRDTQTAQNSSHVQYYAGDGTMVQLHSYSHGGPV